MERAIAFAPDEWFHCYSRGVDKRTIFMDRRDYERFQMLLYVSNSSSPLHLSTFREQLNQGPTLEKVIGLERNDAFVDLGAYALMPNHYHLLIRERIEGGITAFMRKLGTGYTMYFNKKYDRTGALFSGKFKAKHVADDSYLRRVVNYIHANPAELYEPKWKEGLVSDEKMLRMKLQEYPFSSLNDYISDRSDFRGVTDTDSILELVEERPSFDTMLADARDYAKDMS